MAKTGNADGNIVDSNGLLHRHYDARPGTYYMIRPDQHVAARWREFSREKVLRALERGNRPLTNMPGKLPNSPSQQREWYDRLKFHMFRSVPAGLISVLSARCSWRR